MVVRDLDREIQRVVLEGGHTDDVIEFVQERSGLVTFDLVQPFAR